MKKNVQKVSQIKNLQKVYSRQPQLKLKLKCVTRFGNTISTERKISLQINSLNIFSSRPMRM